jgi:hypothetical protein
LVWYDACGTMRECDLKALCVFFILQLFARSVSLVAVTFSYRGIAGHSVQSITERIREELAVHHSRLVLLRLAPYKNSMFTAVFLVMDATVSPLAERKLVDLLNTTIASASKAPKTVKSTNTSTAKQSGLKRQKTVESSEMSDSAETIESRTLEVASGPRIVSPEFLPGDVVLCNMSNKAGWEEFKRCHLEGVVMAQISKHRFR